jgi:hypothetical protein
MADSRRRRGPARRDGFRGDASPHCGLRAPSGRGRRRPRAHRARVRRGRGVPGAVAGSERGSPPRATAVAAPHTAATHHPRAPMPPASPHASWACAEAKNVRDRLGPAPLRRGRLERWAFSSDGSNAHLRKAAAVSTRFSRITPGLDETPARSREPTALGSRPRDVGRAHCGAWWRAVPQWRPRVARCRLWR